MDTRERAISPRQATPSRPLVPVAFAVAAGIVVDRSLTAELESAHSFAWLWWMAASSTVIWWIAWRKHWHALAVWPLLAACAMTAAAWHHARWHLFDRHELSRFATFEAAPVCIEAIASEMVQRLPAPPPTPLRAIPATDRSRLVIDVRRIRDGTRWKEASGSCELTVEGHLLGVRRGDRLRVIGQLARPTPPLNPGEYDFASHARAERQLCRLRSSFPECVVVTSHQNGPSVGGVLEQIRQFARRVVRDHVGPQRAALASAILLGAREELPSEEVTSFFVTGTIHLLVVSGLHLGILVMGLYAPMRMGWLPRRTALAMIVMLVVVYALVAGARPPVMRAAVIAVLMCLAAWIGRRAIAFNSLAAAALIVLALNPAELFLSGTQLSFLAVASLIWLNDVWPRKMFDTDRLDQLLAMVQPWPVRFARSMGRWALWLMVTSGVVWLTALPLVLFRFHVVTPVALLISPALWILTVIALWSGFVVIALSWLIPPLGIVCGAACDWSLGAMEFLVQWAESLPAGHFWVPGPAWWWVVGFYLGVVVVMMLGRSSFPPRWQVAAIAAWVLVGLAPSLHRTQSRDNLDCTFLAVGHGTCVVFQAPNGQTLLYDAGSLGSPQYVTQSIASYLWHRGIKRIDALVISHADVDHYNAVPGLLHRFPVGTIYVSPMMFDGFDDSSSEGPTVLRESIEAAGVPIREIWSGDRLRIGGDVTIDVIHPPRRGVIGSDNANSLTLAVECAGRRILLPGDLESPGIEDVMAELPYDCDVLLAPHHGSRRSDPPGFARWSAPEWVVVSGSGGEDVRPVVEAYERAGAQVVLTNQEGAVQVTIHQGQIHVATWLKSRSFNHD